MKRALKVLVVDDDPTIRDVLRTMLAFEGCEVAVASDGESALSAARGSRPDVVLIDVMMPGIGGLELCRLLKAGPRPPKVVIVTAKDSIEDETAGRVAGADAYITKPFSPLQILDLVGIASSEVETA